MPVDDQHVMAHSSVERNLSDDVHSGIAELQRNNGYVRLTALNKIAITSLTLHVCLLFFFLVGFFLPSLRIVSKSGKSRE